MMYSPQAAKIVANTQDHEISTQIKQNRIRKQLRKQRKNGSNPLKALLSQWQRAS